MFSQQVAQLCIAGAINGSAYALLGVSFALVLGVTGRFHYALALVYTAAGYSASLLQSAGASAGVALGGALLSAVVLGTAIERFVYRPLSDAGGGLLTIFVGSLGVTIGGLNAIALAWSASSRTIDLFAVWPVRIGSTSITNLELAIILACWLLIAGVSWLLRRTSLGRSITAVRGNPGLAQIIGISPRRIYLAVFAIGSLMCGALAVLNGARFAVTPDMGDRPVLYALVVAFLAGTKSDPWLVGAAGLFIGLVESLSSLYVSPQWTALVVFGILLGYLVLRSSRSRLPRITSLASLSRRSR